jgi:hypothetical protein
MFMCPPHLTSFFSPIGALPDECIHELTDSGVISIDDFESWADKAADWNNKLLVCQAGNANHELNRSRIKRAWKKSVEIIKRIDQQDEEEEEAKPISTKERQKAETAYFAYFKENIPAYISPTSSVLGRNTRELKKCSFTPMSIKKVKSLLDVEESKSERHGVFKKDGSFAIEENIEDRDAFFKSDLSFLIAIRTFLNGWLLVGFNKVVNGDRWITKDGTWMYYEKMERYLPQMGIPNAIMCHKEIFKEVAELLRHKKKSTWDDALRSAMQDNQAAFLQKKSNTTKPPPRRPAPAPLLEPPRPSPHQPKAPPPPPARPVPKVGFGSTAAQFARANAAEAIKTAKIDPETGQEFCKRWNDGRPHDHVPIESCRHTHKCDVLLKSGRPCLGNHKRIDCPHRHG